MYIDASIAGANADQPADTGSYADTGSDGQPGSHGELAPTAAPATQSPSPAPTALASTATPAALPVSGGAPAANSGLGLLLILFAGMLAISIGSGALVLARKRIR